MEHGTGILIEQVPARMAAVVIHEGLTMGHFAGCPIIIYPFASIGMDIFHAFGHCAGCLVEVIPTAVSVIFAFDHMAIPVIPDPFISGREIHVFVVCHCSIGIEPIPSIAAWIIDLF